MTRTEARTLARDIKRDAPTLHVTGTRSYGRGSYSLEVLDTVSGIPAVYHTREAWEDRLAAIRFREATDTDA